MALWMSWKVWPIASAGEDVGDIEGAVHAFDVSVRRIQERAMTPEEAVALGDQARTIREQMLSDGA
ncbi:hypothetical protein AB0F07_39420 [Streptomyces fructofermentans]|uniref:hypothetical protein n=1 Tax=Streptomyces fructofermentans TaxID=152141 RepID=UPI0033C5630A